MFNIAILRMLQRLVNDLRDLRTRKLVQKRVKLRDAIELGEKYHSHV